MPLCIRLLVLGVECHLMKFRILEMPIIIHNMHFELERQPHTALHVEVHVHDHAAQPRPGNGIVPDFFFVCCFPISF